MDINELLQCLHKEYTLTLNNPNPQTGSGKITIKIKKSDITENIDEELNQTYSNIRFTLDDEKKTLLPHNLYYDYYYIKLPFFTTSTQIILHILPKSYTYPNDNSVFLFKADMNEAVIEKTPEYQVTIVDGNLKIEFLQKEITPGGEVISPRKPENMTIKQQDPDDYWIKEDEYNNEDIINLEEIPSDVEPIIYNVLEDVEMDIELGKIYNMSNFNSNITTYPINIKKYTGNDNGDILFKKEEDNSIIGNLAEINIFNKLFNENNFYITIENYDSYIQLFDGTKIEIEPNTTPVTNFQVNNQNAQDVIINNNPIPLNTIKKIKFGNNYSATTTLYYMCRHFYGVEEIDFSGFVNVTDIGTRCLEACYDLKTINLSGLVNATGDNYNFMNGGQVLEKIIIGNVDWSGKSIYTPNNTPFYSSPNTSDLKIYASSLQIGNNFKNRYSTLSNWTVVVE